MRSIHVKEEATLLGQVLIWLPIYFPVATIHLSHRLAQAPHDFRHFQEMQRLPHLEEESQERKALLRVQGWGEAVHPEGSEHWCTGLLM